MAIKRRIDDLARERVDDIRGSHPMLKNGGAHFPIWNYIRQNPGCTSADLKRLGFNHQRVSDLINAGLVRATGKVKAHRTYEIVRENTIGLGRDVLTVEITVFKNVYGEFSIAAKLLGEMPGATEGNPRPVALKRYKTHVPRDSEPVKTRPIIDAQTSAPNPTDEVPAQERNEPLTIEGEFTIIPDESKDK